jgi:hypothetical protein
LRGRFAFLHWSVADQTRGGHTAIGNLGERDLVIEKGSTTLAVVEAVICDRAITQEWMRKILTSHFQKLVGYSTCQLFFHVTYSYIKDPASVLEHLKSEAKNEMPPGFVYIRSEDIPFTDSRPTGFIAQYRTQFGVVRVTFLVLDIGQYHQRRAAQIAESNNPRTGRKGKQGESEVQRADRSC